MKPGKRRVRGIANLEPTDAQRDSMESATKRARVARWIAEDAGQPQAADQEGREYFAALRAEYERKHPGELARRAREEKDREGRRRLADLDAAYEAAAAHDEEQTRRWIAEHGEPTDEDQEEADADRDLRSAALDCHGRP